MKRVNRVTRVLGRGALLLMLGLGGAAAYASPESLIRSKCLTCHTEGKGVEQGQFSRISQQRKTPEGWLMTIGRMQVMHGLQITPDERRTLVKHLADTQGLAPSETAGSRYILERRLNTVEKFDSEPFTQMCARCHTGARVLLQRRAPAEWAHLVHFHLGQYPTTEYQAMSRDRDWLGTALNEMVPELARMLPLESADWKAWQKQPRAAMNGDWTLSGHLPGKGGFSGVMTARAGKRADHYTLELKGRWDDGTPMQGKGKATVYTGYEWRAGLEVDGVAMRQVFALEDGVLRGRMFVRDHDEVGADVVASRAQSGSRVLAVHPAYLKLGQETELTIVGSALKGKIQLPAGVEVLKVVEQKPDRVRVRVRAGESALGVHDVAVGSVRGGTLAVYERIAAIKVLPALSVSRFGGNGGQTAKVEGRFDAEAWAAGPDGKLGTADDYRVGIVPARWSVAPFDEAAERDQDVRFSGVMQADTGIFIPGDAGPNPARRMMASNGGNLKVIAEVMEGNEKLQGEGQMVVAVPRWNTPPIP